MTAFEKEVIDRLGRIETKLDTDYRTLHGDGKPGLVDKLDALEDRVRDLETRREEKQKHFGVVAGAVGFVVNAAIALYAALRKTT